VAGQAEAMHATSAAAAAQVLAESRTCSIALNFSSTVLCSCASRKQGIGGQLQEARHPKSWLPAPGPLGQP
jgi:hypothetical protein